MERERDLTSGASETSRMAEPDRGEAWAQLPVMPGFREMALRRRAGAAQHGEPYW